MMTRATAEMADLCKLSGDDLIKPSHVCAALAFHMRALEKKKGEQISVFVDVVIVNLGCFFKNTSILAYSVSIDVSEDWRRKSI